ncbi:uncharacterized protein LOC132944779 [Metopolophium dirhodum]|uniref:uncharacterized protein LOC132944741 n=1 Tax=Metopolophium dirhodum TaxID=44670 RepID=UPI00298F6B5B|nr:uncharacterized protein LOC132944741 [Metopolophium dirhodum]XP_060870262.1 uncharacterized protein LOC132944779 [Metopolophium dirhodum]
MKTLKDFFKPKLNSGDNDPNDQVLLSSQCSTSQYSHEESERGTSSTNINVSSDEYNHNSDLHPDDPKNIVPLNQIEFKQRVIRGPHQPDLEFYPRSSFSGTQRSFQKSWFKLFSWLEYSPKFDLAFCFPCRMFNNSNGINVGQTDKAYTTTGYKNWKAATIKFKAHQMSKVHLTHLRPRTLGI